MAVIGCLTLSVDRRRADVVGGANSERERIQPDKRVRLRCLRLFSSAVQILYNWHLWAGLGWANRVLWAYLLRTRVIVCENANEVRTLRTMYRGDECAAL